MAAVGWRRETLASKFLNIAGTCGRADRRGNTPVGR
jgi:hypothetical protein